MSRITRRFMTGAAAALLAGLVLLLIIEAAGMDAAKFDRVWPLAAWVLGGGYLGLWAGFAVILANFRAIARCR